MTQTTKQRSKAEPRDSAGSSNCSLPNNSATRSKYIRRFFELQPGMCTLADIIGVKLHWRDKVLWGDDVQLSFLYGRGKGVSPTDEPVALDEAAQAELAMMRLMQIADARKKWGTLQERAKAIIDEFDETIAKPYKIRRMHFSVAQNNSLDSCWVFGGGLVASDMVKESEVELCLIGEERVRGKGKCLNDAVEDLREKSRAFCEGKEPSGKVTRFTSDDELQHLKQEMGLE